MTAVDTEGSLGIAARPSIGGIDHDLFYSGRNIERFDVNELPKGRVTLSDLNILQQTRTEYDPDGIRELALSMIKLDNSGVAVELIHPPIILEFDDPEALTQFLKEYDDFYGVATDPSRLTVSDDGKVRIVDAGHRRSLAMKHIAETLGVDLTDFTFPATIKQNTGFNDAVSDQVRENIHDRPPKSDEVRMIHRYFVHMSSHRSRKPTQKQCAQELGLSERVVSEALRYAELPREVQAEFEAENITYENALSLYRLQQVLTPYYGQKFQKVYRNARSPRTLVGDVRDELMATVAHIKAKAMDRASAAEKNGYILAKIASIEQEMNHAGGLFEMDYEETPQERRRRADVKLGRKALQVTLSTVDALMATDDGRRKIEELRDALTAALQTPAEVDDEMDEVLLGFE